MSFLCRQPNGLLCRFSTVEDSVTHYNMTDEEYIELRIKQAEEEAREFLSNKKNFYDFEEIKDSFVPNLDMSLEDFEKALVEMGDTEGLSPSQRERILEYMEESNEDTEEDEENNDDDDWDNDDILDAGTRNCYIHYD